MNSTYWILCFIQTTNTNVTYLERALSIHIFHGTLEAAKEKAKAVARERTCVTYLTHQLCRLDSEITVREV